MTLLTSEKKSSKGIIVSLLGDDDNIMQKYRLKPVKRINLFTCEPNRPICIHIGSIFEQPYPVEVFPMADFCHPATNRVNTSMDL